MNLTLSQTPLHIYEKQIETFDELLDVIKLRAKGGEIFFRIDLKPPFPDTPENWEDKVESAFNSYLD